MTQIVTLEDGRRLEFPDDASPAEIEAVLKAYPVDSAAKGPPSTLSDVGKSAAVAPFKAVAGFAGLPGDVRKLAGMGRQWAEEYLRSPPEWFSRGAAAIGNIANPIGALAPTSGQLRGPIEAVTGKWYEPQTREGKAADTAVQTGVTLGSNWVRTPLKALGLDAAITAGTEGAGAATGDHPIARLFGGLLGGAAVAVPNAIRSRPGNMVRDAIGAPPPPSFGQPPPWYLTDAQIEAGIARQGAAAQQGIPLLGTEALDRGHHLAAYIRSQPAGARVLDPFLNARGGSMRADGTRLPGQVETAVNRDIIAPTGPMAAPQDNAARAQAAAERFVQQLEQDRANLVEPFYTQARKDPVSVGEPLLAAKRIRGAAAGSPESQSSQFGSYADDLTSPNAANFTVLDKIYRRARDAADLPIVSSTADQDAVAAAKVSAPILRELTEQSPNLRIGRRWHEAFTNDQINPVTSGPVGVVAGRTGFDPSAPSPVPRVLSTVADQATARPETIRTLYTALNDTDKRAFPGIVQTHLENQLNAALDRVRTGPNPTAGAKFLEAVAGTPKQHENFNEMMRGVALASGADPDAVVAGANNLLKTLELTGRTPGIGSTTQGKQAMEREMGRSLLGDVVSTVSATPTTGWAARIHERVYRARNEELARILTAPDSVQQLVKLAKVRPDGLTAKYYAASLLGLDRAISSGQ